EQERADVAPINVRVSHKNDTMVPQLVRIEARPHAGTERGDERPNLLVGEHLVFARLLDVEDLATQGQDRLEATVAALFRRTPGTVALDQVQLALARVALGAVGELAGEGRAFQGVLAGDRVARHLGGAAGALREQALLDDLLRVARVFFKEGP